MKQLLEKLLNETVKRIDPKFNYDIEHWENGNFDDSYQYGFDSGMPKV